MAPFNLDDLRGGVNDTDSPPAIAPNQVVLAENIDWTYSNIGQKRAGSTPITVSGITAPTRAMFRHLPASGEAYAELWVGSSRDELARNVLGVWSVVGGDQDDPADDQAVTDMEFQSLHGKMHTAFKGVTAGSAAIDRMHVWDGLVWRRSGLESAEGIALTVTDSGSGGGFTGVRYYRFRWARYVGSTRVLLSEPSDSVMFTPSGTDDGASIERATPFESDAGITHWILEASVDNANFYELFTTVVLTDTVIDTTPYADGYTGGDLSADIGDYTVPYAAKYVAADEDRLLIGGSYYQTALASRISWTPVWATAGVGNDERIPIDTNNFLDLDWADGGEVTGLSQPVNGVLYAFKIQRIYKLNRTGQRTNAYVARRISDSTGALPFSVVSAVDETGQPAVYFLDAQNGLSRFGQFGVQDCGDETSTFWTTVNINATTKVCHAVFFTGTKQIWYWLATNGENTPNALMIVHTRFMKSQPDGTTTGGVSFFTGDIVEANASCMFSTNVESNDPRNRTLVPFFGKPDGTIHQAYNGSTDDGVPYRGRLITKPYLVSGITQKNGVKSAAIMAVAQPSGGSVSIRLIADYGTHEKTATADLTPEGSESRVVRYLDDLNIGVQYTMQLEIGDIAPSSGTWNIDMIAIDATLAGSHA